MLWQGYSELSDAELHTVWECLRTIPGVKNAVPTPVLPAGAPPGE
jgi:hypothetical protein